jgi:hypothetical protein
LVGFELDVCFETPGQLLHRAIACQTRHIQPGHPSVACGLHDTRHQLSADTPSTPTRLHAEGRFRDGAFVTDQPQFARASQPIISEIAENGSPHCKAKLGIVTDKILGHSHCEAVVPAI